MEIIRRLQFIKWNLVQLFGAQLLFFGSILAARVNFQLKLMFDLILNDPNLMGGGHLNAVDLI